MEFIFCMQVNISNILKVLNVTSLQYLNNISKNNLGMEFIFCMQVNIKASKSISITVSDGSGQTCPMYSK